MEKELAARGVTVQELLKQLHLLKYDNASSLELSDFQITEFFIVCLGLQHSSPCC